MGLKNGLGRAAAKKKTQWQEMKEISLAMWLLVFLSLLLPGALCLHPHPRLILTPTVISRIKGSLANDPTLSLYYAEVKANAAALALLPLTPYSNCTVIGSCRNKAYFGPNASYLFAGTAGGIITNLAFIHLMESENPATPSLWSNRALEELLHVCGPSWPSWYWPVAQALERAAMAHSVGLGFDWLFPLLSQPQRALVVQALADRVFATRLRDEREQMWWIKDIYNWAVNANIPLLTGALAVLDEPACASDAQAVLQAALLGAENAVPMFEPSGLWPEGPNYGSFTHTSIVSPCAALASSGLSPLPPRASLCAWGPGLCAYPLSASQLVSPRGTSHNWADGEEGVPPTSSLFAAATGCGMPQLAVAARALRKSSPANSATMWDVVYYSAASPAAGGGGAAAAAAQPLAVLFADPSPDAARGRKTHMGAFRSAWTWDDGNASKAVWVSFKGGQNHFDDHGSQSHNNHGHHDIGSFVLEAQGVRWAIDLGGDAYDYPLLSYFGRFRFGYYYLGSEGHNVLAFDGDTQSRRGSGGIASASIPSPLAPPFSALLDVTSAYGGAGNVTRAFHLEAAANPACAPVRVVDQWTHPSAKTAVWRMHTTAEVEKLVDGSLLLSQPSAPGASLRISSGSSGPAQWDWEVLSLPPPQSFLYPGQGTGIPGGAVVRVISGRVSASAGVLEVVLTPCASRSLV